ncbi:hypothetical protein [uncultured Brachyspira sp.]|uniref:hypothetical protein n=1 Tax=uncultured Brachyspira sp. TaxID=221953 RepID=UPI00260EA81B|nr:hypothetical protein [uncultured Brachyspira sp.]
MNKKLLLILSILMSLSLLTMSCAKSVVAPDEVYGTAGFEDLTEAQLETALKEIPPITDNGAAFDFSQSTLSPSYDDVTGPTYYTLWVNSGNYNQKISQNNILTQLKRVLTEYKGDVTFTPNQNWDSVPTTYGTATLTVQITSLTHNVPQELQTLKIQLYSGGGWQ